MSSHASKSKSRKNRPYHKSYENIRRNAGVSETVFSMFGGVETSIAFSDPSKNPQQQELLHQEDFIRKHKDTIDKVSEFIYSCVDVMDTYPMNDVDKGNLFKKEQIEELKEICKSLKDCFLYLPNSLYQLTFLAPSAIGIIALKAEGNCFINPLKVKDRKTLVLYVLTCNGYVFCPYLDSYFEMTEIGLLKLLYEKNDSIRFDQTLSQFITLNVQSDDKRFITTEMSNDLGLREGLTKQKFELISAAM